MRSRVLVDTNILIEYLRKNYQARDFLQEAGSVFILPAIVVAELNAGVRGETERNFLDDWIGTFEVISVTREIAIGGGGFKRKYGPSHGVCLADALIAATVLIENAELATLNVRHYPMFPDLKPAYGKRP